MQTHGNAGLERAFWRHIHVRGPDECWHYTGDYSAEGHGLFTHGGRCYVAHRLAWALAFGPAPYRVDLLHDCGWRSCCNPAHLHVETLADRFWAKVALPAESDGCWLWTGSGARAPLRHQYGELWNGNRRYRASHVSWFLAHGAWPGRLFVCHRCDTPRCVNPAHLFLGTARDNTQDMVRKGRWGNKITRGEANNKAKLTPARVRDIRVRYASGATLKALAAEHGVTFQAVWYVVQRVTWKHVP